MVDDNFPIPDLRLLSFRSIVLTLFRCNASRLSIKDATCLVKYFIRRASLPKDLRESLLNACSDTFTDVQRWWDKHGEIFQERKAHRTQHLRLFFDSLVWNNDSVLVDDLASAKAVMAANADWPQLQFQFACAYAMESEIRSFDKIRMRAFARKLNDHPLFDFWFAYLKGEMDLFNAIGLSPHQLVSLAFQWALSNGYLELTKFLWQKVTVPQREFVAMLQWRNVCKQAKHKDVFQFLCDELCQVNYTNLVRITTPIFLYSVHKALDDTLPMGVRETNGDRVKFLLDYACERLKRGLFETQNFRALLLCMQKRNAKVLRILQSAVSPQLMMTGVERVGVDFPLDRAAFSRWAFRDRNGPPRQWSMG